MRKMIIQFFESIKQFQDADQMEIRKQRSETGRFKGYWINLKWLGKDSNLNVMYDITKEYTRIIWDEAKIPLFTPGVHKYWDDDPT